MPQIGAVVQSATALCKFVAASDNVLASTYHA
jgi:hypothetical protein